MIYNNISYAKTITNLVYQGKSLQAITFFSQLHKTGTIISEFLLSATMRACGRVSAISEAKQLHCIVTKTGFDQDVVLMTSLMDTYSKCNRLQDARQVFNEMPDRDVVAVNTMVLALCWSGLTHEAVKLFDAMPKRNVESWNSLISGLGHSSRGRTGFSLFRRMRSKGADLDDLTMVSVLSICTNLAAMFEGKQTHALVIRYGFILYLPVGNAIMDMYAKNGAMNDALSCFNTMHIKNVVSWTTLIEGYGNQGLGTEAVRAFDRMETEGVVPNEVTFLGVLHACSHSGLVQEGFRIFEAMTKKYFYKPKIEHYTCVADILARSGRLKEACSFIEAIPMKPDVGLLTAVLSSCCWHMDNLELARSIGEKLLDLKPRDAGPYVLVSNLYGLLGDLEGVAQVNMLMTERGLMKETALTWIEVRHRG